MACSRIHGRNRHSLHKYSKALVLTHTSTADVAYLTTYVTILATSYTLRRQQLPMLPNPNHFGGEIAQLPSLEAY